MPFAKGQSGNPHGRAIQRPFANALNDEIAAAGANQEVLREIARNLLRMAKIKRGGAALPAVMALADRLDGKPAQESMVTVVKRDASDWTREELVAFLQDASRQVEEREHELKVIEAKPIEPSEKS